jgi:hypothetical protein
LVDPSHLAAREEADDVHSHPAKCNCVSEHA